MGNGYGRTIFERFKVLFQVRLCALTPGADRVRIVLESGTGGRKFKQVGTGLLARQYIATAATVVRQVVSDWDDIACHSVDQSRRLAV